MATINLKDYYPWYTQDEFVEVSDEVAAELSADKRYNRTQERIARRNKVHSLDADDGTEITASIRSTNSPEAILELKERHCRICQALNSLPEIQGRRIEAHYILGKSRKEIAKSEGVGESSVNESIERGLRSMKIFLRNSENSPVKCP